MRRNARRQARPGLARNLSARCGREAEGTDMHRTMQWSKKHLVGSTVLVFYAVTGLAARRRGYPMGGNVVVRCRKGHLFTTIWLPGASLKSVRLGWWRFQRCPVGKHWSLVAPVKESDLTEEEKRVARENRDIRIP
jgi:hypothetical protein